MKKATIQSRPGWQAVSAVRDDRIFEIKSTYILQPGPASLTEGVRQIHAVLSEITADHPTDAQKETSIATHRSHSTNR